MSLQTGRKIVGIGEILWDLIGGTEHLGGAVFNFCAHSARLGHPVSLISAVGDDEGGRRALAQAAELGLSTRFIRTVSDAPTGIVSVTVDQGGQPSYVIHRPAAYDFAVLDEADWAELVTSPPDWIAFGTLHSMAQAPRRLVLRAIERFPAASRFYDINLRRDSYTPELVESLLQLAHVVKLNDSEVQALGGTGLEAFCRGGAERYGWRAVCVTRGSEGCALLMDGEYLEVPGYRVQIVDTVGAGDAFAAALLHGIDAGWPPRQVAGFANRLGAFVASRAGAVPAWTGDELLA